MPVHKPLRRRASAANLGATALLLMLGAGSHAQSIIGGGVFIDREPSNNTVGGASYYLDATQSRAIAGLASFGGADSTDCFGVKMPANTFISAMTVPLSSPTGPFLTPSTSIELGNGDGSITHLSAGSGQGTDQSGSVPNSGGSLARARPVVSGTQKIRVDSGESGDYALLVSIYTGDNGQFVEQEPNNGPAFPVMLGLSIAGPTIGTGTLTAGDFDYYGVDMKRGEILAAFTTPVEDFPIDFNTPDTVIDLIGTNGATILLTNDDAGVNQTLGTARGSAIRYRAPADGRYYVRVRGFNASTTGRYSLTAALFSPPPGTECLADLNGDGVVNTQDLTMFLGRFGVPCP
jgi:hypothetical protein